MNPQRKTLTPPFLSLDSWRNRLAHRIANWSLNRIASPDYRDLIRALIKVGLDNTYNRRIVAEHGDHTGGKWVRT